MKKHAILPGLIVLVCLSALSFAQAPVPFISLPLLPDATAPGGSDFTLTVNGTGFVSSSVVNWNGTPLVTQFVSGSQLTATVPAADVATASTANVTVANPAPGGGTSNIAFFTVASNVGASLAFTLASSPVVGDGPFVSVVSDFNGDGKLDLAVIDAYGSTVSILLGDGTGNFTLSSTIKKVTDYPESVAIGDFNGDGKSDLAIANTLGNTVSILVGDGTGKFSLASSPAVGSYPDAVAAADFNGDGKLDLAVANGSDPGTLSILLGDGTGNFTQASFLTVGEAPLSVAAGDFNGDGKLDLVVANHAADPGTLSILLGDGAGNFTLASSPAVGEAPESVSVGDLNRDGKLDLVVVNYCGDDSSCQSPGTVSILLGDGTGNFVLSSSVQTGARPGLATVADFNGDGNLDVAVASNSSSGSLLILLGDGVGNFTPASSPVAGVYPYSVAVGDFNGDGRLDLAVASTGSDQMPILLQTPPIAPMVKLSPTSLIFGTQLVGTVSGSQSVTVSNTGTATLNITSIAASTSFSQKNNCGSSLAGGLSCTIRVSFKPNSPGTHAGSITITDNAGNSPQTVSLTGVGTAVTLLPASLTFSQPVGTTSAPQTVTLTNYGSHELKLSGSGITGDNRAAFAESNDCGMSVPAGGNCTFSITFTPKGRGSATATLGVADDGGASPQTVALTGNGT